MQTPKEYLLYCFCMTMSRVWHCFWMGNLSVLVFKDSWGEGVTSCQSKGPLVLRYFEISEVWHGGGRLPVGFTVNKDWKLGSVQLTLCVCCTLFNYFIWPDDYNIFPLPMPVVVRETLRRKAIWFIMTTVDVAWWCSSLDDAAFYAAFLVTFSYKEGSTKISQGSEAEGYICGGVEGRGWCPGLFTLDSSHPISSHSVLPLSVACVRLPT